MLRGLAILGTLLTNIWIFSTASVSSIEDLGSVGEATYGAFDSAIDAVIPFITDGKWIGLLTIMFGIGLEIQRQSALRKGGTWPGTYPWRAALLVLEGTLNYLFVFEFDVLMGYGLTALVVAAVLATSPRVQAIWLGIGVTLHLALLALLSGWFMPAFDAAEGLDSPEHQAVFEELDAIYASGDLPTTEQVEAITSRHGVDPAPYLEELEALEADGLAGAVVGTDTMPGTDSYWEMVQLRAENFLAGRGEIPIMLTMGLGLFLIGAFLYRRGLFLPEGGRLRRWMMAIGFGIGIPLDVLGRTVWSAEFGMFTRYGTSSVVAFGVLAAVAAFYARRTRTGWVGTGLSWVGRMALTCYIMQNVLCSIIFYDFGLGLATRLPAASTTAGTLVVYAAVAMLLVLGSGLWLRFFPRGPFELVMHPGARVPRRPGASRAHFWSEGPAPPVTSGSARSEPADSEPACSEGSTYSPLS